MAAMNPHRVSPRDVTTTLPASKAAGAIQVVILEVM